MGRTISLFASALFGSVFAGADNSNLVIPPLDSKAALPEKMLVLIPGANVATSYYSDTAAAIQAATDLKLWVVVPEIADKLCISVCPSSGTCFHLGGDVDKVIGMAKDQGYAGPSEGEGVFMSGHSLGATCADNLVRGYEGKYQALVTMGGYVADQNVADYSVPVFTLGAELDEGPTALTSHIFPGIHYCKFLSPARVIEYYMTDGLKASSTCLNTDSSSVQELLEAFVQ